MTTAESTATGISMTQATTDTFVAEIERFARDTLRPDAIRVDDTDVPRRSIDALRRLGALNHLASPRYGGRASDPAEDRRLHEVLAGNCLNTWLVWAQHAALAPLIETGLRDEQPAHELFERLLRGELLAGAALSDVRRYPDRFVRATPAKRGWRLNGVISWVSGWGLNRVLLVAGVSPSDESVVLALVPVSEHLTVAPLRLAAVSGSRTVRVTLRDVFVEEALVLSVIPLSEWRERDRANTVRARPHLFGLAHTVLEELLEEPDPLARRVATEWAPRVEELRDTAYAVADSLDAAERGTELLALRIRTGEALTAIARALLVARAGRGLDRGDSAQFYVRSAHFLLVQAQSDTVRAAQLRALAASR